MTNERDTQPSLRDVVLESIPPDQRAEAITRAAELGVVRSDDIGWALLGTERASIAAAQAAGEAAAATQEAAAKIPDAIYQSTVKAASDVRAIVGDEVKQRGVELGQGLAAAIRAAADMGAAALKQAAADLPAVAAASQDEIVRDWKAALAQAARDEARGALAGRMARSWGLVVGLLLLAAGTGAGGMWAAARLSGHLTPWADPLRVGPTGAPVCGVLRAVPGQRVCLVR
jgi:hypothetical protein